MAKQQQQPVKVSINNGPTFVLNDIVEFDFDKDDTTFKALYQASRDASDALNAYLREKAGTAFNTATGFPVPAGYTIKAGLSRFGGASNGKGWLVVDRAEKPKVQSAEKRGFAKWA